MNVVKFNTEQELDQADAAKLEAYKENASNVNARRFAFKIEYNSNWYMGYSEDLSEYYSEEEISRIEEITIEEQ